MSGPGAGFEYPPRDVSWLKRDALLFAASIGAKADELHFLYELHPEFQVFPTYPIILPFKGTNVDVIDFYNQERMPSIPDIPKLDVRRVLDGQRRIEFLKPLPASSAGKKFQLKGKVLGVYDKGKPGTVVDTQQEIVCDGEVYARVQSSAFYVGQGGWGGPKGPSTVNYPPPERAPDAVSTLPLSAEAALLYRLNGDYNPLHADPAPGHKMGFGGAIMHGLYSWNASCHAILRELGASSPANIRDFQARFASPVKPGDTLVVQMWRTGEKLDGGFEEVRFVTRVGGADGKVVLSNGRAAVKVQAAKSGQWDMPLDFEYPFDDRDGMVAFF